MSTALARRASRLVGPDGQPFALAAAPVERRTLTPRRDANLRYDAAQTTDDNRRHWAHADALSANAAANPGVRRTLRMRARYEYANNSYAKGIVDTLAYDTIGTGPRLQMLSKDRTANTFVEAEFTAWARAVGLAAKLRTMRVARAIDGEVFAIFANNPGIMRRGDRPGVTLDIVLVEADQVTTPYASIDPLAVDGIIRDQYGNPTEYHVLRHHPGDSLFSSGLMFDFARVPARLVMHYFRPSRPGQARGIGDIVPSLPLFAQLRRYTLAVLACAETAADIAAVIYSDAMPDPGSVPDPEAFDLIELEKRMATILPPSWKLGQLKAEQPVTQYPDFVRTIIREAARPHNMPVNVALGDSSAYNFASGRMDYQVYGKTLRVDLDQIEIEIVDRVFYAWLDEAVLIEGYLPQSLRARNTIAPHRWFWDGREHVDPTKEANAQDTKLRNGMTNYAREYAVQGLDADEEHTKAAASLGLTLDEYRKLLVAELFGKPAPAMAGVPAGGPDDDDKEDDE